MDCILTGLPRSGLTVAAALLDSIPNSVCINHPIWQVRGATDVRDAEHYCRKIISDFAFRREQLLGGEAINDLRAPDGTPLLDGLHDAKQPQDTQGNKQFVPYLRSDITNEFTLSMKHHVMYTALLPELLATQKFAVIAIIRNPLDVINSWLQQPKARAYANGMLAEAFVPFWPEGQAVNDFSGSLVERMAQLYDLFLQRYSKYRQHINIVKYEEMIANPMVISNLLGAKNAPPAMELIREKQRVFQSDLADEIRAAITQHCTQTQLFYSVV